MVMEWAKNGRKLTQQNVDAMRGIDSFYVYLFLIFLGRALKVHKREKFFASDFEFFTILLLIKLKY